MRARAVALVFLLVAASAGCGGDDADPGTERTGSTTSSPFTVGAPPPGFELVTAGTGTQTQAWGDDSFGNDDPFTVLAPEGGDATSPDIVVVSITGFEGYQGGLGQASRGIDGESFQVDGQPAIFVPTRTDKSYWHWADLVVQRGEDLAVRATARDATREELIEIARRVKPSADHLRAPQVPDPPNSLHVVGSVDAHVVVGFLPAVGAHSDQVPGTSAAHGVGFVNGTSVIAVMTLPGRAAAIAALPGFAAFSQRDHFEVRSLLINGRPGTVITSLHGDLDEGWGDRSVLTTTEWGDIVMVSARSVPLSRSGSPADNATTEALLVELTSSVRRADAVAWERLVETALGGPGLQPDPGAVEVVRGKAGALEWLLQAREQANAATHPGIPTTGVQVDTCLKLSNRKRIAPPTSPAVSVVSWCSAH